MSLVLYAEALVAGVEGVALVELADTALADWSAALVGPSWMTYQLSCTASASRCSIFAQPESIARAKVPNMYASTRIVVFFFVIGTPRCGQAPRD